jgi:hypothetical protein
MAIAPGNNNRFAVTGMKSVTDNRLTRLIAGIMELLRRRRAPSSGADTQCRPRRQPIRGRCRTPICSRSDVVKIQPALRLGCIDQSLASNSERTEVELEEAQPPPKGRGPWQPVSNGSPNEIWLSYSPSLCRHQQRDAYQWNSQRRPPSMLDELTFAEFGNQQTDSDLSAASPTY